MKSVKVCILSMAVSLLAMPMLISKTIAQTDQLVAQLATQLGVSQQQVDGGIGALMKYAEKSLAPEQFSQIADALPELVEMRHAVPADDENASKVKELSALLGDDDTAAQAEKLASLRSSMDKLDLSSEHIGQFIPALIDYAKSRGGDTIANLLKQALLAL